MRFTLKTLFVVVSVAAVLCCAFFALPGWLSLIVLGTLFSLVPPALIAGIVYGRGYGRAFSIGGISAGGCLPFIYLYYSFAFSMSYINGFDDLDDESVLGIRVVFAVILFLVCLGGLAAISVRWLSLRANRKAGKHRPASPGDYSLLHGRVSTIQMESTPIDPEPRQSSPLT